MVSWAQAGEIVHWSAKKTGLQEISRALTAHESRHLSFHEQSGNLVAWRGVDSEGNKTLSATWFKLESDGGLRKIDEFTLEPQKSVRLHNHAEGTVQELESQAQPEN